MTPSIYTVLFMVVIASQALLLFACSDGEGTNLAETLDASADAPSDTSETSGDASGDNGLTDVGEDAGDIIQQIPDALVLRARIAAMRTKCTRELSQVLAEDLYLKRSESSSQRRAQVDACLRDSNQCFGAYQMCSGISLDTSSTCMFLEHTCEGETSAYCDDEGTNRRNCETLGMVCTEDGCVDPEAPPCPVGLGSTANCIDGRPSYCSDSVGLVSGDHCASSGLSCGLSEYVVTCQGTGADCESISIINSIVEERPNIIDYRKIVSCDGNNAAMACIGSQEHGMACSEIHPDFRCQEFEGVPFCGLASNCYGPQPPLAKCDGTDAILCVAGLEVRVNPAALDLPDNQWFCL